MEAIICWEVTAEALSVNDACSTNSTQDGPLFREISLA